MVDRCPLGRLAVRLLWILVIQALVPGVSDRLGSIAYAARQDPLAWKGPDGQEARFGTLEDLREFMQTARILQTEPVGVGVTQPRKLLLEKDGIRLHAHFQSYDVARNRVRVTSGEVELNFRDSYKFNIAAYELSRLLGMENVPPSFPRTVRGEPGAITVWIEDVFSERSRQRDRISPPRPRHWSRQMVSMWIFDELIGNVDRNLGNILIDHDWRIWLIDHTRAFRLWKRLEYSGHQISSCERQLWQALLAVTDEEIRKVLKPWLETSEIKAVLARKQLLIDHIEALIDEKGGEVAIFEEVSTEPNPWRGPTRAAPR